MENVNIKSGPILINRGFKKEIGVNMDQAIEILNYNGVTTEDITKIIEKFGEISDFIERREIPYECRFLLLNIIFYSLFKSNNNFRKKFVSIIESLKNKRSE